MNIQEALEELSGLVYATSDKSNGNMSFKWGESTKVIENRRAFLNTKGISLENCAVLKIGDEDVIVKVENEAKGKGTLAIQDAIPADALLTQEKEVILFLFTGDCCPIAYYDPINKAIALAHCSWKSSHLKLASKVVARMTAEFGSNPKDLIVAIGPSVRKDSYTFINPEQKKFSEWAPFLEDTPSGETKVDIAGFNRDQLIQAGVLSERIAVDPHDTISSERFYSHYRSVRTGEPEERFATIIGLK